VRRYRRGLPDAGEIAGLVLLGIMGVWGLWFAWQSLVGLWWPVNAAYTAAGLVVAVISTAVGWALLSR
jgi:hypothetical protein